jgi:hypothetical protein
MNLSSVRAESAHPLWLWPNLLGLDAPVVAVSWQWLFARVFQIELPVVFHLILGLSVWCIYLADRLFDVYRTAPSLIETARRRFSRRRFGILAALVIIAAVANGFLIFHHVPANMAMLGLLTACLIGVYYGLRLAAPPQLAAAMPREGLCGVIFALGSVIAPLAFLTDARGMPSRCAMAMGMLAMVCTANCVLISIWEKDEDLAEGDASLATRMPRIPSRMRSMLWIAMLLAVALAWFAGPWRFHAAVAASLLGIRVLLHLGQRLEKDMLRVLTDVALLTPWVFGFI